MKQLFPFLLLLLGLLMPQRSKAVQVTEGFYRIQLNEARGFAIGSPTEGLKFSPNSSPTPNRAHEIWKLKSMGEGWAIINLGTGSMVANQHRIQTIHSLDANFPGCFYIKDNITPGCVAISNVASFQGNTAWHKGEPSRVIIWTHTAGDSQWRLLPVSEQEVERIFTTNASIKTALDRAELRVQNYQDHLPQAGVTYRLVNRQYPDRSLSTPITGSEVNTSSTSSDDYSQLFHLELSNDGRLCALRNVVTQKYISQRAGRSQGYQTTHQKENFRFALVQSEEQTYCTFDGSELGLHDAQTQGHAVVAWESNSNASQWRLVPVEVDPTRLQTLQSQYQQFIQAQLTAQTWSQQRNAVTQRLSKYFNDAACTQLKSHYQALAESDLRAAMTQDGLPSFVQATLLRVKQQTWNANNDLANSLERTFRIDDFTAHSDPFKWQNRALAGTSFPFSKITSPTGITAAEGEMLQIYVGNDTPAHCTLEAELVEGFSTGGQKFPLRRGFNLIFSNKNQHLYIRYNIDETHIKLADCPPIRIHIEGGRVNGYYDRFKHNDETWEAMKSLTNEGFLQDEVFRLKSKCYVISHHTDNLLHIESQGAFNFRGERKGLSPILERMDAISLMEQDMMGVDQFYDRFNCLHFYSSNNALYATSHGIWMGKNLINYNMYTHLGENNEGGNLWALAHETGHHFQALIDLQGCKESSNNLFSTVANWKFGGTVSRGGPMKDNFNNFQNDVPWVDRSIAARVRMYYQLWQYYELLGNHPDFYQKLANHFRQSPIAHGNANTDYLYFARTVCDIVQEDLSDFFAFHGFFSKKKMGSGVLVSFGDNFYDNYYNRPNTTINSSDIDATIAHIKRYPKKGAANLFFIDDRIRPSIDESTGLPRTSCSGHATIGDSKEVGDVGMYTDFRSDATPQPSQVALDGSHVYIRQQGAVGYKVYDAQGQLVFVSNANHFVLPESLDPNTLTIKVAGGNGQDITIIEGGEVLPQYQGYTQRNTTGLLTSTNVAQPEHSYHICNGNNINNWLGRTSAATTQAQRAAFALFPAAADNCFYLLNTTTGQWLSYDPQNASVGRAKVIWKERQDKAQAQAWKIEWDEKGKGFDLFPIHQNGNITNSSWNWHGGASANNPLGFYDNADANSVWQFIPTSPIIGVNFLEGSNGHFATLCLPHAVSLPRGVQAFTATHEGDHLSLQAISTPGIVPQNTPVLLQSEQAGLQGFRAVPTPHASLSTIWTGAHYRIPNAELDKRAHTYYALTRRADQQCVLGIIGAADIPATKAYLVLPAGSGNSRPLSLQLPPKPTAIEAPEFSTSSEAPIYDLSGRRVSRPTSGVYLQNGKRIIAP